MDFNFKHSLGQNFISDSNLLDAIVADSGLKDNENVLEIGTGAGALTRAIANHTTGKVLSIEIDRELQPILEHNLGGCENVVVRFGDFLKIPPSEIVDFFDGKPFRVIANLPYYITTPIMFYLLDNPFDILSITVMVQKELADRLTAKPDTKDYGGITVVLGLYGKVRQTRMVSKKMFRPMPKVDSAIINIEIEKTNATIVAISRAVKIAFMMRRKTLVNNLMQGLSINRQDAEQVLIDCDLPLKVRAENVTPAQYEVLASVLQKNKYI